MIIGAGATALVGWVATEYPLVDITDLNSLMCWFQIGSVQAFLAEHVWEHLVPDVALAAAVNPNPKIDQAARRCSSLV